MHSEAEARAEAKAQAQAHTPGVCFCVRSQVSRRIFKLGMMSGADSLKFATRRGAGWHQGALRCRARSPPVALAALARAPLAPQKGQRPAIFTVLRARSRRGSSVVRRGSWHPSREGAFELAGSHDAEGHVVAWRAAPCGVEERGRSPRGAREPRRSGSSLCKPKACLCTVKNPITHCN